LFAGEEFPGEVDGIALEVVAEAEVAQHFEEGVVTCGVADVFQVVVLAAGAHAFLAGGGAGVGALVKAEEHVLELVHAGIGKQQGGIFPRYQRAGGYYLVAFGGEEIQEFLANFGGFHVGFVEIEYIGSGVGQHAAITVMPDCVKPRQGWQGSWRGSNRRRN
jgi:hypothetical protein